ncbi:hypothetical protein HNQ85_002238 [Anoxybacillus calidus]|uniref:Lipoprotein n=1 Tax=[Anoxybacillus] calidus TaxID=575178 RepID=A0A7V9Z122_9BACL|nr:hypothetical protein [Anoxybacillus calidus]
MKKLNSWKFCLVVGMLVLFSVGCSRASMEKDIQLSGTVKTFAEKVVVNGQSNLPEGAVIQASLKEEGGQTAREVTEKVAKDGTFSIVLKRPVLNEEYELSVAFLPELQPKHVERVYGKKGENIKKSDIVVEYKRNGKRYRGIMLYDRIFANDGISIGQQTILSKEMPAKLPKP